MNLSSPFPADLDACAREPIHIPGAIQPHGALLAATEPDHQIVQVSANTAEFLGAVPGSLLGCTLGQVLGDEVSRALASEDPAGLSPWHWTSPAGGELELSFQRSDGLLLVELEPAYPGENLPRFHRRLEAAMQAGTAAPDLRGLYDCLAATVAEFTGYERVMVYQFDADWNGEVVAERLNADVETYLGHHFPASDIPEQARALYAKTWLRIIPTSTYTAVPLEPPLNPLTERPLDLSHASLRSVSPIHLEYLRNMGVGASMSISLMVGGKLWGLIACHHRERRPLSFSIRAACQLFGQFASREIDSRVERRRLVESAEAKTVQTRFFDVIAEEENIQTALLRYAPSLLEFMNASGVAISYGNQCQVVGRTPPREQLRGLLEWLPQQVQTAPVFVTDSLSKHWSPASEWHDIASGLLAIRISRVESHWVLWFRAEVLTTVTWAGNPEKPAEQGLRLHPRKSFAAWQQTVTGRSLPWTEWEISGAHELRLALNALVIRRTERLLKLNAELERKNSDLNSFAYIASHDLREPLRGIFHFARFLREDHGATLGEEGLRKVDTIATMAAHTNDLLSALSNFSRLGRMELAVKPTDLQQLVDDVLLSHAAVLRESGAEVRRPRPLPTLVCDPVLVREVFANLVSNALRYNEKPEKWVEITWREPGTDEEQRGPILLVRDNGIGIRERNFEAAFQMFRRLNKDRYPGGSGAGLAIVKNIVERHGGRIWVESEFGVGTLFCFTLS